MPEQVPGTPTTPTPVTTGGQGEHRSAEGMKWLFVLAGAIAAALVLYAYLYLMHPPQQTHSAAVPVPPEVIRYLTPPSSFSTSTPSTAPQVPHTAMRALSSPNSLQGSSSESAPAQVAKLLSQ